MAGLPAKGYMEVDAGHRDYRLRVLIVCMVLIVVSFTHYMLKNNKIAFSFAWKKFASTIFCFTFAVSNEKPGKAGVRCRSGKGIYFLMRIGPSSFSVSNIS